MKRFVLLLAVLSARSGMVILAQDATSDATVYKVCSKKQSAPCATPPRVLSQTPPGYSDEGRQNKIQGAVALHFVVGTDGRAHNIRVTRPLGQGMDEKAIEALEKWTFKPGTKDNIPVPVEIDVQVDFHYFP